MTKICAVVHDNGLPIRLALAPRHQTDSLSATDLLDGVQEGGVLLADKAYDRNAIRSLVFSRVAWANIAPRLHRRDPICFSPCLYRERNLVERLFNRIKHSRRVATR